MKLHPHTESTVDMPKRVDKYPENACGSFTPTVSSKSCNSEKPAGVLMLKYMSFDIDLICFNSSFHSVSIAKSPNSNLLLGF